LVLSIFSVDSCQEHACLPEYILHFKDQTAGRRAGTTGFGTASNGEREIKVMLLFHFYKNG
jgi:hypothetical protein